MEYGKHSWSVDDIVVVSCIVFCVFLRLYYMGHVAYMQGAFLGADDNDAKFLRFLSHNLSIFSLCLDFPCLHLKIRRTHLSHRSVSLSYMCINFKKKILQETAVEATKPKEEKRKKT
jgi:hypothetical protein